MDTSAIVNAASAAGAFDPESAQLVVFIGEESSSIAIIDGGELRELRSIKQGAMTHIPAPVGQVEQSDELDEDDPASESEGDVEEQGSDEPRDLY